MSGLNKTDGEPLPGIGVGKVVPVEKWDGILGLIETSAAAAYSEFRKAGAPKDTRFTADNILVQEYYLLDTVVFIYWKRINGVDHYYPYTFKFGKDALVELAASGKWPSIYAMPKEPWVQ